MEGPRAPYDNEFPSVVKFLDSNLRPQEGWSIASEYPLAFSEGNLANIRIIKSQDEVLSHAVMRPLIVKTPAGLFKIGAIGSVVTSTAHRSQGLSTKTIESCLEAARGHGCDFAILWTNLYDFYRKMGFELAGSEISVMIDREMELPSTGSSPGPSAGLKFMDSPRIAAEPIHRLHSQHTVSSLRTLEETRRYLQIPNSRIYTAWDERAVLKAYAIEGKGADLNGYIHEWGGGVSSLLPLFTHIRKVQARPITVIVPRHSMNLIRSLQAQGAMINEGFLGMVKLLNPGHLFDKIKRYARSLGIAGLVIESHGGFHGQSHGARYDIGIQDRVVMTVSEGDLVQFIFGPIRASGINGIDPIIAQTLERVLPLPMWIWGWDSI